MTYLSYSFPAGDSRRGLSIQLDQDVFEREMPEFLRCRRIDPPFGLYWVL